MKRIKLDIKDGQKFGMLSIINEVGGLPNKKGSKVYRAFLCRCDCGNSIVKLLQYLTSSHVLNCGCKHSTHRASYTKLYKIYAGIKKRCSSKSIHFKHYRRKGIQVCHEWKDNFITFRDWALSNGYKEGLQIDRINNAGNYEPSNCRWVTALQNTNNRDITVMIDYKGERVSFSNLIHELNLYDKRFAIRQRIDKGWPAEKAFHTPIKKTSRCR